MVRVQNIPKLEITGPAEDDQSNSALSTLTAGLLDEIESRWETTNLGMSTMALCF